MKAPKRLTPYDAVARDNVRLQKQVTELVALLRSANDCVRQDTKLYDIIRAELEKFDREA